MDEIHPKCVKCGDPAKWNDDMLFPACEKHKYLVIEAFKVDSYIVMRDLFSGDKEKVDAFAETLFESRDDFKYDKEKGILHFGNIKITDMKKS